MDSESNEVNPPTEGTRSHGPVSAKKLEANRRNAQRSTGPRTAQGKAAIRWNAVKHGLLAKEAVVKIGDTTESAKQFQRLLEGLVEDCQPVGVLENIYLERIALAYWRLRRAVRSEAGEICRAQDTAAAEVQARHPEPAAIAEVMVADMRRQLAAGKSLPDETLKCFEHYCDRVRDSKILNLARAVQQAQSSAVAATVPSEQEGLRQELGGLVEALLEELQAWEATTEFKRHLAARDIEIEQAVSAIPERAATERIGRYEITLRRELDCAIDGLERAQLRRRAEDFAKQSQRARVDASPHLPPGGDRTGGRG